jgi:ADP-ribosylglycohydrolase
MPVQELDRSRAREILGSPPDFRDGPLDNPIARGLPAGSVTDDTMQCVIIAKLLVEGRGVIAPRALADALMHWEREMANRGRAELLGPSTRRALAALAGGADPSVTGRTGTTNGAAMRIAPVGVATPARPFEHLLEAVVAADRVTHDTPVAHAGAAVVASFVSAGVDGASFDEACRPAIDAASYFGFADLFEGALRLDTVEAIADRFGTGVETRESVVVAFGIARLHSDDAWEACARAAALGGDADTMAALAGAMVGACTGLAALPAGAVRKVREVNSLELESLVERLLALRSR